MTWGNKSEKSVRAKIEALETVHSGAGSVEVSGLLETGGMVVQVQESQHSWRGEAVSERRED